MRERQLGPNSSVYGWVGMEWDEDLHLRFVKPGPLMSENFTACDLSTDVSIFLIFQIFDVYAGSKESVEAEVVRFFSRFSCKTLRNS